MSVDFRSELGFDKYRLLEECEEHSDLYGKWAELWADASEEEDAASLRLDLLEAKLALDVRKNWKKYGYSKAPSNDAVKEEVRATKKYQKAKQDVIEAKALVRKFAAAKSSFEHRKTMISNAVTMFMREVDGDPHVPFKARKYVEGLRSGKDTGSMNDAITKGLSRRKKKRK